MQGEFQVAQARDRVYQIRGLELPDLLPEKLMSNTMTVVYMPEGKSYKWLHDELKKRGFVIYASAGKLSGATFRLGTVGIISKKEINAFLCILRKLL